MVSKKHPKFAVVRRWDNVTSQKLAHAVFEEVKGDFQKLRERPDLEKSIWGRIMARLGKKFSSKTDRFWGYLSFHGNKQGVKVI